MKNVTIDGLSDAQANAITMMFEDGDLFGQINDRLIELEVPGLQCVDVVYSSNGNTVTLEDKFDVEDELDIEEEDEDNDGIEDNS